MASVKNHRSVLFLTELGLLCGIVVVMAFTPLGYLRQFGFEITFLQIPVAVGAILLGPTGGAILGAAFGITSFIQCFGMSWLGALILSISPLAALLTCLVPRVLMGWLVGWIFRGLHRVDKTDLLSYGAACLSGALLNTVLFISLLLLFFGGHMLTDAAFTDVLQADSILKLITVLVGINGIVEAVVCTLIGTAVAKPLAAVNRRFTL